MSASKMEKSDNPEAENSLQYLREKMQLYMTGIFTILSIFTVVCIFVIFQYVEVQGVKGGDFSGLELPQ